VNIWHLLLENRVGLANGLLVTVQLASLATGIGVPAGIALAVLACRFPRAIGTPLKVLTFTTTSVPILCLLFLFYYPVPFWLGINAEPFFVTAFTLCLVNCLGTAAIVTPAIVSFPRGYLDAAKLCGLTQTTTTFAITLPLLVLNLLAPVLSLQVTIFQATIFGSLISVNDVFRIVQQINSENYQLIPSYAVLAVLFLLLCAPINLSVVFLRRRLRYLRYATEAGADV